MNDKLADSPKESVERCKTAQITDEEEQPLSSHSSFDSDDNIRNKKNHKHNNENCDHLNSQMGQTAYSSINYPKSQQLNTKNNSDISKKNNIYGAIFNLVNSAFGGALAIVANPYAIASVGYFNYLFGMFFFVFFCFCIIFFFETFSVLRKFATYIQHIRAKLREKMQKKGKKLQKNITQHNKTTK